MQLSRHAVAASALLALALGGLTACGSNSSQHSDPVSTSAQANHAPTSGIRSHAPTTTPSAAGSTQPASQPTLSAEAKPSATPHGADGVDEAATSSATTPSPDASCGTDDAQKAVDDNLDNVPGVDNPSMWDVDDLGTYDSCAALSWVTLSGGGTGSSIRQQMLFHHGKYLGATTSTPIGFNPATVRLSDASIQVTYTYNRGNESNAEASGRAVSVYTWNPDTESIDHTGEWPPGIG